MGSDESGGISGSRIIRPVAGDLLVVSASCNVHKVHESFDEDLPRRQ
jgi:hypothetical protein